MQIKGLKSFLKDTKSCENFRGLNFDLGRSNVKKVFIACFKAVLYIYKKGGLSEQA